jgi:5-methylcytosine-specific restriction endonuclease McrBC GTP-binding regulatory subunit McrB
MQFKDIQDLTNNVNASLATFCNEFQYKRKELFGLGRAASTDKLFEFKDAEREWVINPGGGTEIQYHLFFRDNTVGYGLGFNTQYVPFANERSTVDYMKPYAESFLLQPKLFKDLSKKGYGFIYGTKEELKELKDDNYILIGKEIKASKKNGKYEIPDPLFQNMIDEIKGILFKTYTQIASKASNSIHSMKRRYSITEFENMFKDYLNRVIPNSASNYLSAVPTITRIGVKLSLVTESLYNIQTPVEFTSFFEALKKDEEYNEKNSTGHNMYSSSLKKYKEFLTEINISLNAKNKSGMSLNQILFGPPGTGKTYNSINKAISIVNADFDLRQDRTFVKDEYDRLEKEGQILFTTFHQSMSYEDFIEGIKPIAQDSGDSVTYGIEPGIFKIACARAAYLCYKKYAKVKGVKSTFNFEELYNAFLESIRPAIKQGKFPTYKTMTGKDVEIYEINSQNSIKARAKGSKATHVAPLTEDNIEKLYNKFSKLSEIEDLQAVRDTTQVSPRSTEFYAIFGAIKEFERTFKPDISIVEEDADIDTTEDSEKQKKFTAGVYNEAIKDFGREAEPVVLIIDEINRGNVSQIFGELITLIEDDKRFGKLEGLELLLPYSKKKFGVPPNLYIIGTMNTADRSVEALDTALRRRFTFEEIPPIYGLEELQYEFAGSKAFEILQVLNKRIEKLLDKDHQIGHSYFILKEGENSNDKMITSFYKCIIPLLQEYFFGDFGKIGLVLGEGFVNLKKWDSAADSFAKFDHEGSGDFESRDVFRIIDYRIKDQNYTLEINKKETAMDFEKAIKLLMKQNIA